MNSGAAILTHALSKSFGSTEAVHSLDLSVLHGRITAFLGRNGAGKSTTIKMLLGMTRPTSGSGNVLGKQITIPEENLLLRQHVAYVAEDKPLYGYMTVEQTIRFARSFYPDWDPDAERTLLREYQLPPDQRVKSLSKGMRTKLALLLALARRPSLLILDEPTEGLDPVGIEHLLQMLVAQAASGVTVFFSSHQIAEVERVADEVRILDKGRLVVSDSLDELRQSYRRINLLFPSLPPEREFLNSGVERIQTAGREVTVWVSSNSDALIERARDLSADSIEVAPLGLREIFLETVKEN